ncbi:MAG: hypothetical protein U1F36_24095 [Planctomycetota bacterium]
MTRSSLSAALLAAFSLLPSLAWAQGGATEEASSQPQSGVRLDAGRNVRVPQPALQVLYDNGPIVTHPGAGFGGADESRLQNSSLLMSTLGFTINNASFRLADDFTVTDCPWYVTEFNFFGYQTNSTTTSTFTAGYIRIWNGDPSLASSSVVFGDVTTNRLIATGFSNTYRTTETSIGNSARPIMRSRIRAGVVLQPGTYWVEVGLSGSLASGPFSPPVTITGSTAAGNGLQLNVAAGTWVPMTDAGSAAQQQLAFNVVGDRFICYEPNIGASLGHGDDSITGGLALGFNFPMPGGGSTAAVSVCSNGYVSMNPTFGIADFTPSVAELLSQSPRICTPWDDYYPPAHGTVHFNALPGKAVATWNHVATFNSAATDNFTQITMFPSGAFTIAVFRHEPVTFRTPIIGVSGGNGSPDPGPSDFSAAGLPVNSGASSTVYEVFTSGTSDLSGTVYCFVPNGIGGYIWQEAPACYLAALATPYGTGCPSGNPVTMSAVTRPIVGTTCTLNTANFPVTTIAALALLGINSAATDLTGIGMTGCTLLHDNLLPFLPTALPSGDTSIAVPLDPSLVGATLKMQGAIVDAAFSVNPLGVALSNAMALTIGTF